MCSQFFKKITCLFFICSILGCSTSASLRHSTYFSQDFIGKKMLTKEVTLCQTRPGYTDDFYKKIFPRQDVYFMDQLPGTSGCLDSPVTISSTSELEIKDIVHVGKFEGGVTYAVGFIFHPIQNRQVPFYILLSSPGYSGLCNNPNAPFSLTATSCKKYFDHLNFPWQ